MNVEAGNESSKIVTTMHLLLLLLFLAAASLNQAYAARELLDTQVPVTSFAFKTFNSQSCSSSSNLICTGSVTAADGFLSLTPELEIFPEDSTREKVGRVLYSQPVVAWPAYVTTTFTVRIVGASNLPSGDGMTFIFAPDNSSSLADSTGYNLGIVGQSSTDASVDGTSSNIHQLAVELDTYKNDFDIDGNHISVDTTSVDKPLIAVSLNSTGIELKSGKDIKFQIDYNSWTKWLEVHAAYDSDPLVKVLSLQTDITAMIPNYVYVGFTAATGYFTESHQLLSWEFKSTTTWNR